MAFKDTATELSTILTSASDKLNQLSAQYDAEVAGGTITPPAPPVDGAPTDKIYTKEEAEKLTLVAVATFKAELKAKYEEQQVAETSEETGFASLLQ